MAFFYRPRLPKRFDPKPIYWDPKKEALNKRIDSIRQELVQEGKLSENLAPSSLYSQHSQEVETQRDPTLKALLEDTSLDREEAIHKAFIKGTRHLQRQEKKGIDRAARRNSIMRSLVVLLLLCIAAWLLFFR